MNALTRNAVFTVALALLAWTTWRLLDDPGLRGPVAERGAASASRDAADVARAPHTTTDRVPRTPASAPEIRVQVVDADTAAPLPESCIRIVGVSEAWLPPSDERVARADTDGIIRLVADLPPDTVAVASCPGRLSRVVPLERNHGSPDSPITVKLEAGRALRVSVRSDNGLPVSGASVIVQSEAFGAPAHTPIEAVGNPASRYSVWIAETDARGQTTISDLPARRVWVSARHPLYAPSDIKHVVQAIDIVDDSETVLVLAPLWGAVYDPYEATDVSQVLWHIDYGKLVTYGGIVNEAASYGVQYMESRFPGSLIFVHRPLDPANPPIASCRAVDSRGRMWAAAAPLRRLSDIHEPVFMEVDDDSLAQAVRIRIRTPAGRFLKARLGLRHKATDLYLPAKTDIPVHLPPGEYALTTYHAGRALWDALSGASVSVTEGGLPPQDVIVDIDAELVQVTVRPVFIGRRDLSVIHVAVKPEEGRASTVANWRASEDPLVLSVPTGELRVSAKSAAYEDASTSVNIDGSATDLVVDLELRERQP